jgi:hypothetical protein
MKFNHKIYVGYLYWIKNTIKKMAEEIENIGQEQVANEVAPVIDTVTNEANPSIEVENTDVQGEENGIEQEAVIAEADNTEAETEVSEDAIAKYLAKQGISMDEIKNYKESKDKGEAEKNKVFDESKEWADFTNFAVANNKLTKDDILKSEEIKKVDDLVLAKAQFAKDFNDFSYDDLSDEEKEEEINEAFEEKYGINSENELLKKIGQKEIEALADEARRPILSKVDSVKSEYIEKARAEKTISTHKQIFNTIKDEKLSTEIKIGNEVVKVEIDAPITLEDYNADLAKDKDRQLGFSTLMVQDEAKAKQYMALDVKAFKEKMNAKALHQAIYEKAYESAKSELDKYRVGARAPFGKNIPSPFGGQTEQDTINEVIRKTLG